MARARNIKPGFYKNEDLAECSIWARYIFPGLWTLADREGRLEDRPKRIKAELLPFDDGDVDAMLQELQDRKFIVRYQNSDGKFIQIIKFKTHQSPHYSEKASVIKPPELPENVCDEEIQTPRKPPDDSGSGGGIKRGSQPPESLVLNPDSLNPDSRLSDSPNPESLGKASARAKRSPRPQSPGFGEFWAAYPKKAGRQEALQQWNLLNPDSDLSDRMMAALEEQKQSAQWSDPQFIPDARKWLKRRRWEDELPRDGQPRRNGVAAANRQAADEWLNRHEAHEAAPQLPDVSRETSERRQEQT